MRHPFLASLSLPAALGAALLAGGCGGGSAGADDGAGGTAFLVGSVLEVDGRTTDLGGVTLSLAETGQQAVSGADGSFVLGVVPTGSLTLRVGASPVASKGGADDGPGHDVGDDHGGSGGSGGGGADDGPNHDVGDDRGGLNGNANEVEVHGVRHGEHLDVRVRVRGGQVASAGCSRSGGDDETEAEARLARSATSDDTDITGYVELETRSDRERLKVEVEHATPGRGLEAFLVSGDGTPLSLGTRTVTSFGEAEWRLDSRDGPLPFGASAARDLAGVSVEVRDAASGAVLLSGAFPTLP